tara:strand:+ start:445 stop:1350 length:906 start_codon:yes stop_codon:yes gene_type:complete
MKKLILILLCLTGFSFAADYQIPSQLVGSSPTSVSLGTNIFENEAIAVFETDILAKNKVSVSAFNVKTMNDYNTTMAAISMSFKDVILGVGVSTAGTDGIEITAEQGIDNEIISTGQTYKYINAHYKGSITYYLSELVAVGGGISYYSSQIYNTTGAGFNGSISTRFKFNERTDVVLVIENILSTTVQFDSSEEALPMQMVFASRYQFNDQLFLVGSLRNTYSNTEYKSNQLFSFGGQYSLVKHLNISASIFQEYAGINVKNNVAFGTCLMLDKLFFQYAYKVVDYEESSAQHFLAMSINL